MSYISPSSNIIALITDKGRNLSTRVPIEGLSFSLKGWALGRGGYQDINPVLVSPIVSANTSLDDQIYPLVGFNIFSSTDFEFPSPRTVSCACRIYMDNVDACYGIGEIGVWSIINNSPLNPIENGEIDLFAIAHLPIQSITRNTAKIMRIILNF